MSDHHPRRLARRFVGSIAARRATRGARAKRSRALLSPVLRTSSQHPVRSTQYFSYPVTSLWALARYPLAGHDRHGLYFHAGRVESPA
jgi:hypothetical protein